jgi:hypothetical protein
VLSLWETEDMPKANLRAVTGNPRELFCTICKTKFAPKCDLSDLKPVLMKEWDEHLYSAHHRQWEAEQRKKAKFEASRQTAAARIVRK